MADEMFKRLDKVGELLTNLGYSEEDECIKNLNFVMEYLKTEGDKKFYQAEMEALRFCKGWHTLKEWADYGFNKVVYEDKEYWDGLLNGHEEFEDVVNLEMDYWDIDEDGYKFIVLRKGE